MHKEKRFVKEKNLFKGMWIVTIWAIMFHPLFFHNNKYFMLNLWKMVKNLKADFNRLFFFQKIEKNLISVLPTLQFFIYFL